MRNSNRTESMLSPFLNPTLKVMGVSIFPIFCLATLFSYILLIAEQKRGGAPYLSRMVISSLWLNLSKAFTISVDKTQLGDLWLCCMCSKVFKIKLPSWHPTPGVDQNWYLTPRPHRMLLHIFSPVSVRVTPRNCLGYYKSPLFGTGTIWPSQHSSK